MKPCPLPLVALRGDETCLRCGRPAREHRGHPSYQETTMDEISIKDALDSASRSAQIHRDAHKNAADVERLREAFCEVLAIADEAMRRVGVFDDREEAKEIDRLRRMLSARAEITDHDRLALNVGRAVLLSRGYDARVYDEEADEIDDALLVMLGPANTWRAIAKVLRAHPADGGAR